MRMCGVDVQLQESAKLNFNSKYMQRLHMCMDRIYIVNLPVNTCVHRSGPALTAQTKNEYCTPLPANKLSGRVKFKMSIEIHF